MKSMPRKVKKYLWTTLCILAGNTLLAFLVAAFVIPHGILVGGTTGISILISRLLTPLLPEGLAILSDTATIVLALNLILLAVGFFVLGRDFFLKTAASSILYPVILGVIERIPNVHHLTTQPVLAAILGGALLGIAVGLVIRVGASTGGVDVINLILHKYLHWPVAVFVYITDFVILGGQIFFSNSEHLLLGVMFLVIETLVLDQVMVLGRAQMQLFVVSDKYADIRQALLNRLDTGVTMISVETGLLAREQQSVMCVIPPRKLYAAKELIQSIDPSAFIVVSKIKEVRGQGFSLARLPRDTDGNNN